MFTQQLYTNCLAQGAYYIESNGEAAVIDPMREVQQYIDLASTRGAKIKYVFETHFHADFVSGHVDLAKRTGATIVFGPTKMTTGFEMFSATDGQEFPLGKCKVRLIHTPGHTMESSCFLLMDESGVETALFTGDTLFIGDVGRPDLAQKVIAELTQEKLASHLFDSLRNKIMPLSDDLIVYPGHGAGSACGKKMSDEKQDTFGHQKKTNYALNPALTREEFIKELLTGLTPPPGYFPQNVLLNIKGYDDIDVIMDRSLRGLNADAFQITAEGESVFLLDTRDASQFAEGFIPGSVNIGLNGSFAVWIGTVIPDVHQKLLIVGEPGTEEEAIRRMARVGFDNCLGYLEGGMEAWKNAGKPMDSIERITADAYYQKFQHGEGNLLDARKKSEFNTEHILGAQNLPLDYVRERIAEVNSNEKTYVHCAAGYRSMIFVSMLRKSGYTNLADIEGGFKSLKSLGKLPASAYKVQSTEL
jgi:glyoxylase-like metal-dependent hydrolase (beta-lactamase superfamily II)/rhodanese-related sulfurtransferase